MGHRHIVFEPQRTVYSIIYKLSEDYAGYGIEKDGERKSEREKTKALSSTYILIISCIMVDGQAH